MHTDMLTMLYWSFFLIANVGFTAHLYVHMGIIIASQSTTMMIAALIDTILLKNGLPPSISMSISICIGCIIGLLHLPILLKTGSDMLLVLTVVAQLVLNELWLALPNVTGGSGGILLPPNRGLYLATVGTIFSVLFGIVYLKKFVLKSSKAFDWACIKKNGSKSGVFGVPATRYYVIAFAFYGFGLSLTGITATRYLGYLTSNLFNLTWSLTVIMIVLICKKRIVLGYFLLSIIYCGIRVVLRYTVHASILLSNIFELMFPLILLIFMQLGSKSSIIHLLKKIFSNLRSK